MPLKLFLPRAAAAPQQLISDVLGAVSYERGTPVPHYGSGSNSRCRVTSAHVTRSRPGSGLGFQIQVLNTVYVVMLFPGQSPSKLLSCAPKQGFNFSCGEQVMGLPKAKRYA